jgi:hypothetical protein
VQIHNDIIYHIIIMISHILSLIMYMYRQALEFDFLSCYVIVLAILRLIVSSPTGLIPLFLSLENLQRRFVDVR